jgi:hypothetical protein
MKRVRIVGIFDTQLLVCCDLLDCDLLGCDLQSANPSRCATLKGNR